MAMRNASLTASMMFISGMAGCLGFVRSKGKTGLVSAGLIR
jgi:hypothetical protein